MLLWILLAFLVAALLSVVLYTVLTGVAPVPTSPAVRRVILSRLPEDPGGEVFELGAGWGGLALALARRYPHHPVLAYERSPLPWLVACLRARAHRLQNLRVVRKNIHAADLAPAGLLVCYLAPDTMRRLRPKLERELCPGAAVISNFFAVPGWSPSEPVHRAGDVFRSPVYVYRVGSS